MLSFLVVAAASQPWVVVQSRVGSDDAGAGLVAATEAVVSSITATSALSGSELGLRIAGQLSTEAQREDRQLLAETLKLVDQGTDDYYRPDYDAAVDKLGRAREALSKALDRIGEQNRASEALYNAQIFLALAYLQKGLRPKAVSTMEDLIRLFPTRLPTRKQYGPEVVDFYRKVREGIDRQPKAALAFESLPTGAAVHFDGSYLGRTPVSVRDVYPGEHTVQLRLGEQLSRTHRVHVRGGPATVEIDLGYDAALRTAPFVGLWFAEAAARAAHETEYAARLGRELGATRVLVLARGSRGGTAVVEGLLVDARRAAPLRRGAVAAPAGGAPAAPDAQALASFLVHGVGSPRLVEATTLGELPPDVVLGTARGPRPRFWIAAGTAGALLVGGLILALSAQSDFNDLNTKYPDGVVTNPADLDERDAGHDKALAADVLFGVTAAAAVTAALLYVYEGRPAGTRAEITPVLGPRQAGLSAALRF